MSLLRNLSIAVLLVLFNFGNQSLHAKKLDLDSIKNINVTKQTTIKNPPHYLGTASAFGFGYGWVGASIAEGDSRRAKTLDETLKDCGIDIGVIAYEEFLQKLSTTAFKERIRDEAENHFELIVENYGLEKIAGFGDNMRPGVKIKASLVRDDKTVLWKSSASVGSCTSQLPHMKMAEWTSNPEKFSEAFHLAVRLVVTKILKPFALPDEPLPASN